MASSGGAARGSGDDRLRAALAAGRAGTASVEAGDRVSQFLAPGIGASQPVAAAESNETDQEADSQRSHPHDH